MASTAEHTAMRRALTLSAHGLGTTSPNPPVGCVILDPSGNALGEGYHHRKGESHAETLALAAAGSQAKGATAVVTLEPCNHEGRTPACRQALIDAGVARVVIALLDPTSRGDGGATVLREAGVDVETGVLAEEAHLVLGPWMRTLETRRPILWWASSGSTLKLGRSWIMALQSRMDAILNSDGSITEAVPGSHGAGILDIPRSYNPDDPIMTVEALYKGGARAVLVDGGPTLVDPFLRQGLIDHIVIAHIEKEPSTLINLPDGFVLDRLTKELGVVIVEARRTSSFPISGEK
ncbi:bifunctional diaminohydroxyphosphoribosylaminopyrimidine deaminase/5-amino-6-(5-phosphoribosylamino)uracil reductase RibD [Nocardiopsis flavescens]